MTKQLIGAGSHYGYSDMIGLISNATAQYQGTWTVDHDSGAAATPWGKLAWNANVPAGAAITVKVRSSENLASWSVWETATNGQFLATIPDGRYLQVQVTLSKNQSVTAAVALNDLTITQHTIPYSQRDGEFTLTVNPVASPTNITTLDLGGSVEIGASVAISNLTTSISGTSTVTSGSWSGAVSLVPGSNSIRVYAVLGAEQLERIIDVTLDNELPIVTITNPINTVTYKNPVNFSYSASDNVAITAYKLKINGNTVSNSQPGNSLTLNEGLNVIRLEATDQAGNIGFSEVSIVVDNYIFAPSIDPLPTAWKQSSYSITGKTEPGSLVFVNTDPAVTVGPVLVSGGTWSCELSSLTNGPVVINVYATDALGNSSTTTVATLQVALASAPVMLQATDTRQGGSVNLDWTSYSDKAGVATYNLYHSDLPFSDVTGMIPVRSFAAGTETYIASGLTNNKAAYFAIIAVASDNSFNSAVTSVRVVPTRQGVEGFVTDATTGKPLQAIRVSVSGGSNALTDIRGHYAISGLASANHDVAFSENPALRYFDNSGSVNVTAGQMVALNIALNVKATLPPTAPGSLVAAAGDRKVALTWSPVLEADVTGYNVYRGVSKVNPGLLTVAKYTDSGLTNGVNYSYVVKAVNNAGTESDSSNEASGTPFTILPDPPKDLKAELQCDGSVKLSWTKPASSNISGYNIYYQSGTTLAYSSIAATNSDADNTIWTSPILDAGTYTFGVRTQGANEETNQYVVSTIIIPSNWGIPIASIKIPQPGQKVSGNYLHVHADLSTCGNQDPSQVLFQYKSDSGFWLDIPVASVQQPNPDVEGPAYFIQWNVAALTEGAYQLRAIAADSGGTSDPNPGAITIYVDHNKPDYREDIDNSGQANSRGSFEQGRENNLTVTTGNTRAKIKLSQTSLQTDSDLNVETLVPDNLGEEYSPSLLQALTLQLMSGQSAFTAGSEPEIAFAFTDNNNDGFVDGTGIAVQDLVVSVWNEVNKQWDTLSSQQIDLINKTLKGLTSHFSKFSLKGKGGMSSASAPGQIHAQSSSSSGNHTISWDEVSGAGVYYVEESTNSNFKQDVRKVYEGTGLSVTVTGRKNGTYWYRVRAGKAGSDPSDWTVSGTVTIDLTCSVPANLTAQVDNTAGKVILSWDSAEPSGTFYEVETDNGSGFVTVTNTAQKNIELNIGNGTYQYRVKSRRVDVADSQYSAPVSVSMTLGCSTPATISSTSASGAITVGWSVSATAGVNYVLQESIAGGPYVTIYFGSQNQVSLTGRSGSGYLYRVKAQKSGLTDSIWRVAAKSVSSSMQSCKPISGPYSPVKSTTGSYQVNWSNSTTPGVTYTLTENGATIYSGPNTYFNLSNKANGTYQYQVKASKAGYGDSPLSTLHSTTVILTCNMVTYLSAPASSTTGNYSVSWPDNTPGATYVLKEDGVTVYTGSDTSYPVYDKQNGIYSYTVQATKAGYISSAVTEPVTTTVTLTLPPISSLSAPATSLNGDYTVNWGVNVSGATFELKENGTVVYTGTNTSFAVSGKGNGSYSYTVRATKDGYVSTPVKGPVTTAVTLTCAPIYSLSAPTTSLTGDYTVKWASTTPGATYTLQENGVTKYSGPNTSFAFSGKINGSYRYTVSVSKGGYVTSTNKTYATVTVTLTCASVYTLSVPTTSLTGNYTVSWASTTPGVTYTLQENGVTKYSGPNTSYAVSGKSIGIYKYTVVVSRAGYVSSQRNPTATVTVK